MRRREEPRPRRMCSASLVGLVDRNKMKDKKKIVNVQGKMCRYSGRRAKYSEASEMLG